MKEPLDRAIGQSLKEGMDRAQPDFTFTTAMQQNVLARIRAGAGKAAAESPRRRSRLIPWFSVAAAAAVFLVAIQLRSSHTAHDRAGSPEQVLSAAGAAPTPPASPGVAKYEPGSGATMPATKATESGVAQRPADADKRAAQTPVIALVEQPVEPIAGASTAKTPNLMALHAESKGIWVAPGETMIELSSTAVRQLSDTGRPIWVQPVVGLSEQSHVAIARDGRTAVSGTAGVTVLKSTGDVERTIPFSGTAQDLAWSEDGRLAISLGESVAVFRGGQLLYTRPAGPNPTIMFTQTGALALYKAPSLFLYDGAGALVRKVDSGLQGQGMAQIGSTGGFVAGDQVFDATGLPVWHSPVTAPGAVAGNGLVLSWSAQTVAAFGAADGHPVWRAELGSGGQITLVTASGDGNLFAVVSPASTGATLWVVGSDGHLRGRWHLDLLPQQAVFVGGQVVLQSPAGLKFVPISGK